MELTKLTFQPIGVAKICKSATSHFISLFIISGLLFLLSSQKGQGQSIPIQTNLPELLPPSPDAAALVKAGLGTLDKSTGAINVSIPIYELKMHNLSMPVGLSYSSQGLKTDEACSRVGSGWVLNAGGIISRSVLGKPDELDTRAPIPPNNQLTTLSTDNYYLFKNASNPDPTFTFDTQPDQFFFSFGGYSGKFILDANFNAVLINYSNLKVKVHRLVDDITEITITTPDGIVYFFGGNDINGTAAVEKNLGSNLRFKTSTKTAFYLYKIELPTGERVDLYYTAIATQSNVGYSESYTIANGGDGGACGSCPDLNSMVEHKTLRQYVDYRTVYLSRISASNGASVAFQYEFRNDHTNDVRLTSVEANHMGRIKKYDFRYYIKSEASLTQNGLFFLTKLIERNRPPQDDNISTDSLVYDFQYNSMTSAGGNYLSQDHYGFDNDANNESAVPYIPEMSWRDGANREQNANAAKKGMLYKITYPTGGTEEFIYEPSTVATKILRSTMKEFIVSGGGRADDHHDYSTVQTPYTGSRSIVRTQRARLLLKTFIPTNYSGTTYNPSSGTKVAYFKMYDKATNQMVANTTILGLRSATDYVDLENGHTYRIELEVRGPEYIHAHVILEYNNTPEEVYDTVNVPVSGLRVRSIVKTDPVDRKKHTKFYTYASLDKRNYSTGTGLGNAVYKSYSHSITQASGSFCYSICSFLVYSSNTAYNLFKFDGSHLYYTHILESDDSAFANGGTEYTFYPPYNGDGGLLIRGEHFGGVPPIRTAHFTGLVNKIRVFDKDFKIREETINLHESVPVTSTVPALSVKQNYDLAFTSPADERDFHPFDVIYYLHSPGWLRIKSVEKKTYDEKGVALTTKEEYTYGTIANTNVKSITTRNSRNEILVNVKKYANDFPGQPLADLMVSKNMIDAVWEENVTNNGTEISKKVTVYKDWFGDTRVIQPEVIRLKQSPNGLLNNELVFSRYDASGNVLEASKAGDDKVTYIWNSRKSFLIGQVSNASVDRIAYSSFEDNNTDSWQMASGGSFLLSGMTGIKSFTGTLNKTVPAGNYLVTLWSTSSTVTVNGATATVANTKGAWKLLKWTLNNTTGVQITGSEMDEVRLYPLEAEMTTFTIKPDVGIESQCDKNNVVLYYTYDSFNRLTVIRDINQHIIKQFNYKYSEDMPGCTNTVANWVPTGRKRCAKTTNNNNTGVEEQEEIDRNNCSSTFAEVRWASLGVTGNCYVVPNCTGPDKRAYGTNCVIGQKTFTGNFTYNRETGSYSCEFFYWWSIDDYNSQIYNEQTSGMCNPS